MTEVGGRKYGFSRRVYEKQTKLEKNRVECLLHVNLNYIFQHNTTYTMYSVKCPACPWFIVCDSQLSFYDQHLHF